MLKGSQIVPNLKKVFFLKLEPRIDSLIESFIFDQEVPSSWVLTS